MLQLFELLRTVAATASTVLVAGETGTGKELVARAIHDASPRRSQRFVAINCSAIPETLLEAELFGHVRGAFTGAVANRPGRIEQANRGTLFLDEVGTMSPALQSKLLRVLQSREFERVGDSQTIKVDVRVIAATNSDLRRMVEEGDVPRGPVLPAERHPHPRAGRCASGARIFRCWRSTSSIGLPREASPPRGRVTVGQDAQQALMAYDWPGNVRQLENVMERTFALSPGKSQLGLVDLPDELQHVKVPVEPGEYQLPEIGVDLERIVVGVRAHADPAGARAHERQQAPGRRSAAAQADDAD